MVLPVKRGQDQRCLDRATSILFLRMISRRVTQAAVTPTSLFVQRPTRDCPYQARRSKHWVKVENRKHPAISRKAGAAIDLDQHALKSSLRPCWDWPAIS